MKSAVIFSGHGNGINAAELKKKAVHIGQPFFISAFYFLYQ